MKQLTEKNWRRGTLEPCAGGYCRVTFAEKPDRSILDALKAAGFFWCKGHCGGKLEQLPAEVKALVNPAEVQP